MAAFENGLLDTVSTGDTGDHVHASRVEHFLSAAGDRLPMFPHAPEVAELTTDVRVSATERNRKRGRHRNHSVDDDLLACAKVAALAVRHPSFRDGMHASRDEWGLTAVEDALTTIARVLTIPHMPQQRRHIRHSHQEEEEEEESDDGDVAAQLRVSSTLECMWLGALLSQADRVSVVVEVNVDEALQESAPS